MVNLRRMICLLLLCSQALGASENDFKAALPEDIDLTAPDPNSKAVVVKRVKKEAVVESNPFGITFFRQNYVLPYYYTGSPYNQVYVNQIPKGEKIQSGEVKYQLSLKVPVWKNIGGSNTSFYFGYTQLSYWQAYNHHAFFRETDFQPEIFVSNLMHIPLFRDFAITTINVGATHESNGFGNQLERSWNRAYVEAVGSSENWLVSIRPWYVFHDATYKKFNPDMAQYLGYGELTIAYKFNKQVLTLQARNFFEHAGRRATGIFSYSFPITTHLHGFAQVFSGYGQSLIEYNHRTNSIGVGIALSNLI